MCVISVFILDSRMCICSYPFVYNVAIKVVYIVSSVAFQFTMGHVARTARQTRYFQSHVYS